MNYERLLSMQAELDAVIMDKHSFVKKSKMSEKTLAFIVELSELANETRCFKYWSNKGPSERTIILDEYADGLHFLLSLGLDLGVRELDIKMPKCEQSMTSQFLRINYKASEFIKEFNFAKYIQLFTEYLGLGNCLGFTEEEIEEAYFKKNEVNHTRQETGY